MCIMYIIRMGICLYTYNYVYIRLFVRICIHTLYKCIYKNNSKII